MARLPGGSGDGDGSDDDEESRQRPTGIAGPDDTPEPTGDTGGGADDTGGGGGGGGGGSSGGGAADPTGIAGPDDTPEPAPDDDAPTRDPDSPTGPAGPDETPGDETDVPDEPDAGGPDDPTGVTGPDDTPEPTPPEDDTELPEERPTGPTGPDQTPDAAPPETTEPPTEDPADRPTGVAGPDETPDVSSAEGEQQAGRTIRDSQFAGFFRSVRADPGRQRQPEPVAGGRQAARAVGRDPGRSFVDPVAEVEAVSEALDEAFISRRATTGEEFGADIEGFDEVGGGPFDLPRGFGGEQQETAQRFVEEQLEFTEPFAERAEDVRQDILSPLGVGAGTAGGVAAAAGAGVVTPEPVTTVGGAVVLGGLAVGGIAFDVARREGVIEVPEGGELFGGDEVPVPEDADTTVAGETRLIVPDAEAGGEIPIPESGTGLGQPEVPVPEQPPGDIGEVVVPEVTASQFAQQQRQRQREERRRERDRGIFERGGANEEELQEILEGPDEDVVLGEETPPSEQVAEETGREFIVDRDTDPRVVVPEQTVEGVAELSEEARTPELAEEVAVAPTTGQGPLIGPITDERTDAIPDTAITPDTAVDTTTTQVQQPEQVTEQVTDTVQVDEVGAVEVAEPTRPGLETATPTVFEQTPVEVQAFGAAPTTPRGRVRDEFDVEFPEVVDEDRDRRRRGGFDRVFTFPVAGPGAVLGDDVGGETDTDLEDLL